LLLSTSLCSLLRSLVLLLWVLRCASDNLRSHYQIDKPATLFLDHLSHLCLPIFFTLTHLSIISFSYLSSVYFLGVVYFCMKVLFIIFLSVGTRNTFFFCNASRTLLQNISEDKTGLQYYLSYLGSFFWTPSNYCIIWIS
jgi:hypothetical protein